MAKITEEDKFLEKLKYIGLDLKNIPEFIKEYNELEFRPSRQCNDREYTVYQYIPINKIQILLTPTNRLADIKEKYAKAKPLYSYLNPTNEENMENFTTFLNMLHNTSIEDIEQIENIQKGFKKEIPTLVKYEKNYLWQIYYSEYSEQYFMLVPTEEIEYSTFFYLLKQQIKYNNHEEVPIIYVPIVNCVKQYHLLKKDDVIDIEKYLWIFTKNWPNIYEVTDKENNITIEIVGQTYVYEKIQSIYKIKLQNKELADKFYKLIKVLFILQTELPMYYKFLTKINQQGGLDFYYDKEKILYEDLAMLIKTECEKFQEEIKKRDIELNITKNKLEELKNSEKKKEKEYLDKQKEISTYLEYKRTFIGRVKYFFKGKKKKEKNSIIQIQETQETIIEETPYTSIERKILSNYTIEDLIAIASTYESKTNKMKNMELDIEALRLKNRNLDKKIENAKLYIEEIDSHKKSIFEFWKFSSKDELQALNEGKESKEPETSQRLKKVFDYEEDYEDIGKSVDRIQSQNLTKEEKDTIFVFDSNIAKIINMLKNKKQVPDEIIETVLNNLKKEAKKQEQLLLTQDYDIFGNISQDKTRIKVLGNKQHREKEKNLYQILNITEKTQIQEFKESIKKTMLLLNKSINKTKTIIDMPIYKIDNNGEKIDLYGYNIYNINPEKLLETVNLDNKKITLFKVNLPQDVPAIYYSNCIYYDNYNKTLPAGMNISDKVLVDCEKFEFILKQKTNFSILKNRDMHINVLNIDVFEYDLMIK